MISLITLANASGTALKRRDGGYPCFISDLNGKAFSVCFPIRQDTGCRTRVCIYFIRLKKKNPLIAIFLSVYTMNGC